MYLLPAISMSLMERAIQGSIANVVTIFTSNEADVELIPKFDRSAPTPAWSRIWGA